VYTAHARDRMRQRRISDDEVETVLADHHTTYPDREGTLIVIPHRGGRSGSPICTIPGWHTGSRVILDEAHAPPSAGMAGILKPPSEPGPDRPATLARWPHVSHWLTRIQAEPPWKVCHSQPGAGPEPAVWRAGGLASGGDRGSLPW
jgi:hypothetical protein